MPLIYSEVYALKLERYPLRILLPDREIRQGGVCRGGVTPLCIYFSAHLPCCVYPAVILFFFALSYPAVPLFFFTLGYPAVPLFSCAGFALILRACEAIAHIATTIVKSHNSPPSLLSLAYP